MEGTSISDDANEMAATVSAPPAPAPALAPSKTTRHWRVLRNALVAKTRDETSDATASSRSTDFFQQFQSNLIYGDSGVHQRAAANFEWRAYAITRYVNGNTSGGGGGAAAAVCKRILVHEKQKRQKVCIAELFSHKLNEGVDNTGNIRTWPSEQVLLSYLLKNDVCKRLREQKGARIRCCELGGGMAGLASLGLVAHNADHIDRMLVTDGNPQSVENLTICIEENTAQRVLPSANPTTTAELLRWDRRKQFAPTMRHQFELLVASDCLFFEDFHHDLAYTIQELLHPVNGVCLLVQPNRNGSMDRFRAIAASYKLVIDFVCEYDPEISRLHAQYAATHKHEYDADVHFPLLLVARPSHVEK